jgi:hypothetical protein
MTHHRPVGLLTPPSPSCRTSWNTASPARAPPSWPVAARSKCASFWTSKRVCPRCTWATGCAWHRYEQARAGESHALCNTLTPVPVPRGAGRHKPRHQRGEVHPPRHRHCELLEGAAALRRRGRGAALQRAVVLRLQGPRRPPSPGRAGGGACAGRGRGRGRAGERLSDCVHCSTLSLPAGAEQVRPFPRHAGCAAPLRPHSPHPDALPSFAAQHYASY